MLSPQINIRKVYVKKCQGRNIHTMGINKPRPEKDFYLKVTIMRISFLKNTHSEMNWEEIKRNTGNKSQKSGG